MILLKSIYQEIDYGYANGTKMTEYGIRCPKGTTNPLTDEHDSTAHEDLARRERPDSRPSKTKLRIRLFEHLYLLCYPDTDIP